MSKPRREPISRAAVTAEALAHANHYMGEERMIGASVISEITEFAVALSIRR